MPFQIKVNGEEKEIIQEELSVAQLLIVSEVEQPDMVSVQLNGEFVERENFETTKVKSDDEIDFMYFMGGGKEQK